MFIDALKIREPYIFIVGEPAKVEEPFAPVQFIDLQYATAFIFTDCPPPLKEFTSKYTLSSKVGTQLHGVPPLVVDQCEPSLQLPELAIQYKPAAVHLQPRKYQNYLNRLNLFHNQRLL